MEWKKSRKYKDLRNTQAILGLYLTERSKSVVPTSVTGILSMLKAVIEVEHNEIIPTQKLHRRLIEQAKDYKPKKAPTLSREHMDLFMRQADEQYLVPKVITAIGVCSGLRKYEMYALKYSDVTVTGDAAFIKVATAKTNMTVSFAIEGNQDYLAPFLKYHGLRSQITDMEPFLLQVRNGKCTKQRVGEHYIAKVPAIIATLNGLPEPEKYTGHSLKRSSVTAEVQSKRDGRDSASEKVSVAKRICYGSGPGT